MGNSSSIPTNSPFDKFNLEIDFNQMKEFHNNIINKKDLIYNKNDPYNTFDHFWLEVNLLKIIVQKYDIGSIYTDIILEELGLDWKDILRIILNEQNEDLELELSIHYLSILWIRFQEMLLHALKSWITKDLHNKDSYEYYVISYIQVLEHEKISWMNEYKYDNTCQRQLLSRYIREEDLFGLNVEKRILETPETEYYYVNKHDRENVLKYWNKSFEEEDDDLKQITTYTKKPDKIELYINELEKTEIKRNKVIFMNKLIDNNKLIKGIHIVNDKYYKEVKLMNFEEELNKIQQEIKGEMNEFKESEIILSRDENNKYLEIINKIEKVQWEIEQKINYNKKKNIKLELRIKTEKKEYILYCEFLYNDYKNSWEIENIYDITDEHINELNVSGKYTF